MEKTSLLETVFSSGNKIQIEFLNRQGIKVTTKALVEYIEKSQLILKVLKPEISLSQLPVGEPITLICKYNNEPNDYIFVTNFHGYKATTATLVVGKPNESDYRLGRRLFRCDVNIPFNYYINQNDRRNGEIVNLSANGLSAIIEPNRQLELTSELTCQLSLPHTPKPFFIIGKVVRIQKNEHKHKIALHFQHMTTDLQNQIIKFLFNRQQMTLRQTQPKTYLSGR